MKVLFISSEAVPFAKTGGLADVAGSLPVALKRLGVEVHLVLPFYRVVREGNLEHRLLLKDLKVPLGNTELAARVWGSSTEEEVPVYLIEREDMYDRPNIYGNSLGDYYDNFERFAVFARAALSTAEILSIKPDLIHCHDWQTGLVSALLKGPFRDSTTLGAPPTVFTIHNLGYQGLFPEDKLSLTGLSREEFYRSEGLEYYGNISLLKAGIAYSNAVTTVSPAYAREIQTPEYGMGMEGILQYRRASLYGILNGVDYQLWDPARDAHISVHYSPRKVAGKHACKESLIQEVNLDPLLTKRPLLGMISRLDAQKGLDLLVKILAGADAFLIPSRYEPCGLTQMYALKYGTVPIVRATGGLDDTIVPFDHKTGEGNGFKFSAYEPNAFLEAIRKAIDLFQDPKAWQRLMANGMKADFSWERSAQQYRTLYESFMVKK
jgi:starch synthase